MMSPQTRAVRLRAESHPILSFSPAGQPWTSHRSPSANFGVPSVTQGSTTPTVSNVANEAKDVYYRFLEYYNLDRQHAPPLMVVDMESSRPFALDADLVDVANTVPHR